MHRLAWRALAAGAAVLAAVAIAVPASAGRSAPGSPTSPFSAPVKVTPDLGFGYEPSLVIDRYGNVFAAAHKENWQLVVAPDQNSPTYTRSMSWDWVSVDGGQTFTDIPGLSPASLEQHEFGDEGDLALDDAGHLYVVDTNVTDVTFTRWKVTGNSLASMTLETTRPILPTISPLDDRPWVIAHGNGHVFYFGNDGSMAGDGGRYTVYRSTDAGDTFDPVGQVLPDSGWCRPAADHRGGSPYVYVICTNDVSHLYAFVTPDDGATWNRYLITRINPKDSTQSWPTVQVAPDGSIWALYVDAKTVANGIPTSSALRLFLSTDHGQTWTEQDITPQVGHYEYGWLSVSPNGKLLGLGVYERPTNKDPWRVYGAVWTPGSVPSLVSLDQANPVADASESDAPGDFMSSYFTPANKLGVIWTRIVQRISPYVAERDIYYAHQT